MLDYALLCWHLFPAQIDAARVSWPAPAPAGRRKGAVAAFGLETASEVIQKDFDSVVGQVQPLYFKLRNKGRLIL